jgi:rod shape determining protein RodA
VSQAKAAISSGGLLGQGLGQGARTQAGVVPEAHTDFIASVAGEELGLLGLAAVIVLLGVVVLRALRIAARARDAFGALIATGVAVWFAVQGFENVGMCLGLMPVTGIPLPFVSYGGSATIACFVAVGLLLNVHAAGRRR